MAAESQLGKLTIVIVDLIDSPKGFIKGKLEASFNPTEYTTDRSTTFAEVAIPGLDAPVLQYVKGGGSKLNVELFFDITDLMENGQVKDGSSVRDRYIEPLERLTLQHPKLHAPPAVQVLWGDQELIKRAVVTSLSVTYQLFDTLGRPVRAKARVGFTQHTNAAAQIAEAGLTSPDRTNVATVREGDTLPAIAHREYGDATRWRAIAEANGLSSPLALTPGAALVVPKIL